MYPCALLVTVVCPPLPVGMGFYCSTRLLVEGLCPVKASENLKLNLITTVGCFVVVTGGGGGGGGYCSSSLPVGCCYNFWLLL